MKSPFPAALAVLAMALAALASSAIFGATPPSSSRFPDAQAWVDLHNAVRASVRPPAGYPGEWKPIPPVTWSDAVATSAQAWAEQLRDDAQCKLEHSDTRFGENLAGGKGKLDPSVAVKMWAKEGERYAWSPSYEFEIPTGHYTQLVWRNTTMIGCGQASCGSRGVIVCQYSPAGNHIGRAPY